MKFSWKTVLFSLIIIVAIAIGAVYFYYLRQINGSNGDIKESALIKIEANESTENIAAGLSQLNLIKSNKLFLFYESFHKSTIKPGYYEITAGMSLAEVADLINSGRTKTYTVIIPGGYRAEQIGKKLDGLGIVSYSDFVLAAKGDEGKLFPDTYIFDPRMTAEVVVAKFTDNFKTRTDGMNVAINDLILASIVQKEAADSDTDRGIIAGIYQNRIDAGMKLQSDPTVSYGRDSNNIADVTITDILDYTFWKAARTVEFTSVKSLYNTYQNVGLPPAPICNPTLASIQAALNPTASKFYFFLYGKDGLLHPAKTSAEHSANVVKYL